MQPEPSNSSFPEGNLKIYDSASHWLNMMESSEGIWVTVYLGLHSCPSESKALVTLANMMHLESYHYKAKKLGIKKGLWKDYKETFIGKWMLQLDIPIGEEPITEETQSIMQDCLKILCEVALSRITDPVYQNLLSRT